MSFVNTFKAKTELCFGNHALDKLTELVNLNAVIVTDSFMTSSGMVGMIVTKLANCKKVCIFDEVVPDPPIEVVTAGLSFLIKEDADVVIALGGGSSIDAAKAIVFMAKQIGEKKNIKLIAIPTTSGTGSEVTKYAVITDKSRGLKYPLVDEELQPDVAILEAELVESAPPEITTNTGFDVITHAMEAYVSTSANVFSDALAEKSLTLACKYLPRAYRNGHNLEAREKMHDASCLAGMAFNEVGLGINHSIAHAMGAKFHIPHGRANAMLLPHVVVFNANLDDAFGAGHTSTAYKYTEIAKRAGLPAENPRIAVSSLVEELQYMLKMTRTPMSLREAGISREEFDREKAAIVEAAMNDVCTQTNPRPVTPEDIEEILERIF